MDLEIIMLSEVLDKDIYHMLSLTCGIYKSDTNELIYKIEIDSQTLKTILWLPKGERKRNKLGVGD